MSILPNCPICDKPTHYGERSTFHLSFGESPIEFETHGEVGYRDHDYGDNVMFKPDKFTLTKVAAK